MAIQARKARLSMRGVSWAYVVACLGFGCLFAVCPFSSLGTAAMLWSGMEWDEMLFARTLHIATGAVTPLLREVLTRNKPNRETDARATRRNVVASCLVAGTALALLFVGDGLVPCWLIAVAYGLMSGFAVALIVDVWAQSFFSIRRIYGRQASIVALTSSFLLTVVLTWAVNCTGATGMGLLVAIEVLVVLGCCLFMPVTCRLETDGSDKTSHEAFALPGGVRQVLLTLGFLWGLGYSMPTDMGYGTLLSQSFARWIITLLSCGAMLIAIMVLMHMVRINTVHFGLILRWLIVFSGIVWAFEPLMMGQATAANILFIVAFWVQIIGFSILVIEVCLEVNLSIHMVLTRYLVLFVVGSCAGAAVFLLARMLCGDTESAYALMAAMGVSASLLVVPAMPSRNSGAQVLTLELAQEGNRSVFDREQACREFAAYCAFTPREVQVFELLLLGFDRNAIAQRLEVSPLTVKNHVHAIHAKAGVHSSRELVALVHALQNTREHPNRCDVPTEGQSEQA